ncbi:uncharacterized protein LOC115444825 [Manduca sexta]|uniref:Uncharacterized protein n=1 Tax=Manduca sexta TaxID=7130 RepID=A0A922CN85_MANSE|nr:uncharacterized protein LOC115444825 [Manduca sexta]KAG6452134.1 hypothetical protein O3G_MSEX007492 [Manduca sexta]
MEKGQVRDKMRLLFKKLAEPNYVMSNYYADRFINMLRYDEHNDPDISYLRIIPFVPEELYDAIMCIDKPETDISVKVFIIRLLALSCKKEVNFTMFVCRKTDNSVQRLKDINSPNMHLSMKVAYMEMALTIVKHSSGISWLLETGIWKEILSLGNEKRTVFLVRQTYKFAAEFLWRLNDLRYLEAITEVIHFIIKPLVEGHYIQIESLTSDEEEERAKVLIPITHMLIAIISKDNRIVQPSILMEVMVKEIKIVWYLYCVLDKIHNEELLLLVSKSVFWLILSKCLLIKPMTPETEYGPDDFLELGATYFNTIHAFIQRRLATTVLDYCTDCAVIWSTVFGDKVIVVTDSVKKSHLKLNMLFMCLVPLVVFIKTSTCGRTATTTDYMYDYILNFINSSCEHTAKAAYALRNLMLELDTLPLILRGVKKLTYLKHHLSDEQANLVFQSLFYALKEYDPVDDYGEMKQDASAEDSQDRVFVMTYVLDIVLSLVKNHNINWHESLEVICLHSVVFNILKRTNLTCQFIVTALNLIAVTVKKFLPPNLSLLLETKPGSTMHDLGKLIYMKMHDMHWEIRDSALELLHVCTELSYIKFPPFQKQILENNLINVAATIAFNDFEPYVQVSALKCLGAASKVSALWEQLKMQYPNVQDQIVSILRESQEGIVRKEACNVLCDLYQNHKLAPTFKQSLYDHMVSASLCDFHWEVQLSALTFWKIVYKSLLTDQGMLDGEFPPVTFSRESRKIVNLNAAEIQRRLVKILNELSTIGCLTVLVKLLHDDTELEIMEYAHSISNELYDMLQKHKVPDLIKYIPGDAATVEELISQIKDEFDWHNEEMPEVSSNAASDNVIESILNADDINLLANIYEQHMSLRSEPPPNPPRPRIKLVRLASPYLFVNYLKTNDFQAIMDQKRKWNEGIRSFSSLLDDILGMYQVKNEVNALDCY